MLKSSFASFTLIRPQGEESKNSEPVEQEKPILPLPAQNDESKHVLSEDKIIRAAEALLDSGRKVRIASLQDLKKIQTGL